MEARDLLKKLIGVPSISGNETKLGEFLFELLSQNGFKVKKFPVDKARFNLVATLEGKPKVFLQAHMDTVAPQIEFSEDKENIYGRGSCDTKGSIATMVTAAVLAKNEGYNNFGLIFTVGEEVAFDGAKSLIKKGLKIPFVIVGEPSSLEIVNQHFGILSVKIKTRGKAAHSSRPEEGENAIDGLIRVIEKVKAIEVHPKTLMNLVRIEGGIADNIIPAQASAVFNFRTAPVDKNDYLKLIKTFANEKVEIEDLNNVDSVYAKVPDELSFIKERKTVKYATELAFFKKGAIIGPGDIKYAHGPNEYVSKKELAKAVEVYLQIIKNFN